MILIKLKFPQSYTRIYPRKFAGFLKLLILANYFWFSNITLSSKNSHQLGLNQPTDMFHHSTESWEHGEDDRTWAGALRTLCWPPKQRNILLPNSLATVVCVPYLNFWRLRIFLPSLSQVEQVMVLHHSKMWIIVMTGICP